MAAPPAAPEQADPGRPPLEVADIVRGHGAAFLTRHGPTLSTTQRWALADVVACRTAARGGHAQRCADCGQQDIAYNSCRNRHCPKCQGGRTAAWLQREAACLLPVPYFHVVFTLPAAVGQLVCQNRRLGYTLLFRATQETLRTVAANPKHLGAQVGLLGGPPPPGRHEKILSGAVNAWPALPCKGIRAAFGRSEFAVSCLLWKSREPIPTPFSHSW
jgi:hypothetical protein